MADYNSYLAGLPAGVSGAGYGQADPMANLWEYWRPGGNGGGQAALTAFFDSGRWRDLAPGLSDADALGMYQNLMGRYPPAPAPGAAPGGNTAFNPPAGGDLPGIHRPPELADMGAAPSYLPASSPWSQAGGRVLGALDGLGYGQPKTRPRMVPRPGMFV